MLLNDIEEVVSRVNGRNIDFPKLGIARKEYSSGWMKRKEEDERGWWKLAGCSVRRNILCTVNLVVGFNGRGSIFCSRIPNWRVINLKLEARTLSEPDAYSPLNGGTFSILLVI